VAVVLCWVACLPCAAASRVARKRYVTLVDTQQERPSFPFFYRVRVCGSCERTLPQGFSVYVALTNIPEGGLLTGFAMRSDPNVAFGF